MDVGEWERHFCYQKSELSSECLQHTRGNVEKHMTLPRLSRQLQLGQLALQKKVAVISAMVPFRAENGYH